MAYNGLLCYRATDDQLIVGLRAVYSSKPQKIGWDFASLLGAPSTAFSI